MEPILTLTSKDFYTGISTGAHVDRGGMWVAAQGINPFVDYTAGSINAGLLQTSSAPTDVTNSLTGIPLGYTTALVDGASSNPVMYYITSTGTIAKIDISGDNLPSSVITGLTNVGTGLKVFQPQGGTKYLYYFNSNTQLGRYGDLDGTPTQTDNWKTGLQSGANKPMIRFKDGLYFGNVDRVGYIRDDGAGAEAFSNNALDLQGDKLITCLEEDGTFLVVGATSNTGLNRTVFADTRVYFWDTNVSSWSREWSIPDSHIIAMKRIGNAIYALCGNGLYVFNYQTRPQKLLTLDASQVCSSTTYAYSNAIGSINNAVVWGGGGDSTVFTYGEMMQGIGTSNTFHNPFAYTTSDAITSMVATDVRTNRIWTGNANALLLRWNPVTGGQTGLTAKSVYIPLQRRMEIERIEVIFGEPLTTNDDLAIDVQADEDETEQTDGSTWGTISEATNGSVGRYSIYGSKFTQNLKILLTFTGGNVKIKTVNVYGKPAVAQ